MCNFPETLCLSDVILWLHMMMYAFKKCVNVWKCLLFDREDSSQDKPLAY